jgi:hypothetical protein
MPGKTKRSSSTFRKFSRRSKTAKSKMGGRRLTNRRLRRRRSTRTRKSMRYYGRGGRSPTTARGTNPVETNLDELTSEPLPEGQSHRWLEERNRPVREEPVYTPNNEPYQVVKGNEIYTQRPLPDIPSDEPPSGSEEHEYATIPENPENPYATIPEDY